MPALLSIHIGYKTYSLDRDIVYLTYLTSPFVPTSEATTGLPSEKLSRFKLDRIVDFSPLTLLLS